MTYKNVQTGYSTRLGPPVNPGIDISHYGAPFKGMLGLGAYTERPGFDYEYATAGLGMGEMVYDYGAALGYTGPPAQDPRMLKAYSKVRLTYAVSNVPSDDAPRAANLVHQAAQRKFSGNTVRKVGNGWISGGRIAIEVILARPTRLGEIKMKSKQIETDNPLSPIGSSARLRGARTAYNESDIMSETEAAAHAGGSPTPPSTGTPPTTEESSGEFPWLYVGIGAGALVLIGGIAFALRKKPAPRPVAANRRRRRRRRRTSRRR